MGGEVGSLVVGHEELVPPKRRAILVPMLVRFAELARVLYQEQQGQAGDTDRDGQHAEKAKEYERYVLHAVAGDLSPNGEQHL